MIQQTAGCWEGYLPEGPISCGASWMDAEPESLGVVRKLGWEDEAGSPWLCHISLPLLLSQNGFRYFSSTCIPPFWNYFSPENTAPT